MTAAPGDDTEHLAGAPGARAGGVTVTTTGAALSAARDDALAELVVDGVPAALAGKDATLWGAEATAEASVRLGWLDCAEVSRPLLPRIVALREELAGEGVDRVVLAGMGGSSLAPEVITGTYGAPLVVLDTTDPGQVRAALTDLDRTVVVVSSKSGSTVETDSHRRAFEQAFTDAGIEAARRIVVVTDPGSPLQRAAEQAGYRAVFEADPNVGGRYSALTAFGLVPAGLAGVPVGELLDAAAAAAGSLTAADSPGLWLGAALGGAARAGHDKVVLADAGSGIAGFGDWAEQLLAESTGKEGRGLLPVVVEGVDAPGTAPAGDRHLVHIGGTPPGGEVTTVTGPLGGQFLVWEFATAVAGRVLGIDPFDQPNVQESKDNTNAVLAAGLPDARPAAVDGAVEVYADDALLAGAADVAAVLDRLLAAIPSRGYLAVMAYLDRHADADAAALRAALAARTDRPVTFGWAPRFLHSTGQYHKGGPAVGAYLQVTGVVAEDLPIPGRPFTFATLQAAQAAGDLQALTDRDRPVVRLHLTDRRTGLRQLLAAAGGGRG